MAETQYQVEKTFQKNDLSDLPDEIVFKHIFPAIKINSLNKAAANKVKSWARNSYSGHIIPGYPSLQHVNNADSACSKNYYQRHTHCSMAHSPEGVLKLNGTKEERPKGQFELQKGYKFLKKKICYDNRHNRIK